MLQPLETQYLQHESHRIIRRCLISSKRPVSKTSNAFLRLDFKKLSHFRFEHKNNTNGAGGSSGSLVLLLFMRFSRDCTEISLFGSSEVYRSRLDVFGRSARGPAWTFSDVAPGKGLNKERRTYAELCWNQAVCEQTLITRSKRFHRSEVPVLSLLWACCFLSMPWMKLEWRQINMQK